MTGPRTQDNMSNIVGLAPNPSRGLLFREGHKHGYTKCRDHLNYACTGCGEDVGHWMQISETSHHACHAQAAQ